MDKVLNQVLPVNPSLIYRKVVKKVLDPPSRPQMFWNRTNFFVCRKCKACQQVRNSIRGLEKFRSMANNRAFGITEFILFNTTHVIYTLECSCSLMYIGRTKRPLKKNIAEHNYYIIIGFKYHSVSLHFKHHHNKDPSGLTF